MEEEAPPPYASVPQYHGDGAYAHGPQYPPPGYSSSQAAYPTQSGYPTQQGYPPQHGYPPPPGNPGFNPDCYVKGQKEDVAPNIQTQFVIVERPAPPSYLMLSCFVLWCCCVPIGLIAVCFAYSSTSAASRGEYEKAKSQGVSAKAASIAGIVMGVICTVIIIFMKMYVLKEHPYHDWP